MDVQWTDMQSCVVVRRQPTMPCLVFDSAVSRLRSHVTLSHSPQPQPINVSTTFLTVYYNSELPRFVLKILVQRLKRAEFLASEDFSIDVERNILRLEHHSSGIFGSMPWSLAWLVAMFAFLPPLLSLPALDIPALYPALLLTICHFTTPFRSHLKA